MLKKSVFTFFFFLTIIVNAQYSVSGVIHDENNQLLKNLDVELILENDTWKTKTNHDGEYKFENVPTGEYQLKIYKEDKEEVFFINVEDKDLIYNTTFNLSSHIGLNEVNIKKLRSVKSENEKKGFAMNVIDTKEAATRNVQTLELLDKSVGVRIRQNGGLGSDYQFNINGMSGNSIKIFIDGIPTSSYGSSFDLNSIPPSMIERIEVYKGVVPAELADDALGGAVNIILNKDAKNSLSASISYGSFNTTQTNFNGIVRDKKSGLTFKASAFYNYSDNDYDIWGRFVKVKDQFGVITRNHKVKRFNDAFHSFGSNIEVGFSDVKWADNFFIGYTRSNSYKEIQHGLSMELPYKGRYATADANLFNVTYSKKNLFVKGLDVNFHGIYGERNRFISDTVTYRYNWYNQIQLGYNGQPERVVAQQGNTPSLTYIDRETASLRGNLSYTINKNHRVVFNHFYQMTDRNDDNLALPLIDREKQGGRLFSKNVSALSYELRLFEDKFKTTVFGKYYNQFLQKISYVHDNVNGNIVRIKHEQRGTTDDTGYGVAISYLVSPSVMLMASFEKAIRMPTDDEIFGNPENNILENNNLLPESSNNYNLGFKLGPLKINQHRFHFTANGFFRDTFDKIAQIVTSTNLQQGIEVAPFRNFGKTNSYGVDLELNYTFRNLNILVNASRFTAVFKGQKENNSNYNAQLPNEPFFTLNANAQYTLKNIFLNESRLNLFYNFRHIGSFNSALTGSLNRGTDYFEIPDQYVQDLGLSYVFPNKKFIASIDAKNIFNKEAYDNFGAQKPGRAFFFKLNYIINKF